MNVNCQGYEMEFKKVEGLVNECETLVEDVVVVFSDSRGKKPYLYLGDAELSKLPLYPRLVRERTRLQLCHPGSHDKDQGE